MAAPRELLATQRNHEPGSHDEMTRRRPHPDAGKDDRPPICPACGVTMMLTVGDDGELHYSCLECGYPDGEDSN